MMCLACARKQVGAALRELVDQRTEPIRHEVSRELMRDCLFLS